MLCCGSKKWRWFIHWVNWSLLEHSKILRCWTRRLLVLSTRSSRIPVQEECQSGGTESPKRGPVSTRKTDRFHDLRPFSSFMIQYQVVLFYSLLLSVMTTCKNSVQNGTKFYCRCQKFHQMIDILKSMYYLRIRESDQLNTVLELYGMGLIWRCRFPTIKIENHQGLRWCQTSYFSTAAIDFSGFPEGIEMQTLLFGRIFAKSKISVLCKFAINTCDPLLNLLIFCVWLKSWMNDSLYFRFPDVFQILWSTVLLQISP